MLCGERRPCRHRRRCSSRGGGAFTSQPPLSCGGITGAVAIIVDESSSAAGQVLLVGGMDVAANALSTVYLVDLATGVCTSQPNLLRPRCYSAAARSPDGRVVCVGVMVPWVRRGHRSSAEIWRPPAQEVDKGGGDLASASRDECCPWKLQGMCAKRRPLRRAWGGGRK